MNDLNRRNTETVEQALKEMSTKIYDQHVRIDSLNTALSSMSERLNSLETMVVRQKIELTSHGASVK